MNLLYLMIFINVVAANTDYCTICINGSHTLCKYKLEGPSPRCMAYKNIELDSELQKNILDVHNDIRNQVASGDESRGAVGKQPPASDMNLLQWDSELAEIAQRWADQCPQLNESSHDDCKKTENFELGQNVLIAVTASSELPDFTVLILNWYKQVTNVIPADINVFSGLKRGKYLIGQYTQLVWAETKYVGCGFSIYKNFRADPNNIHSQYLQFFVCNYGPAGNIIGKPVYQIGKSCSNCSEGMSCDSKQHYLCSEQIASTTTTTTTTEDSRQILRFGSPRRKPFFNDQIINEKILSIKKNVDHHFRRGSKLPSPHKRVEGNQTKVYNFRGTMKFMGRNEFIYHNKLYKRVQGIWYHGHCRCNYVYRSNARIHLLKLSDIILLAVLVISF